MTEALVVGERVILQTDNPYLDGQEAYIIELTGWGAHVSCGAAATGRHGTMLLGSKCPSAKLNEDQVREIRRRRAAGETFIAIACDYGVAESAVRRIAHRQRWGHLA